MKQFTEIPSSRKIICLIFTLSVIGVIASASTTVTPETANMPGILLEPPAAARPSHRRIHHSSVQPSRPRKTTERVAKTVNEKKRSNSTEEVLDEECESCNGSSGAVSHVTEFVAECNMPTDRGFFKMRAYNFISNSQKLEPIVMIHGDVRNKANVLARVHDQCFTGEVFGSRRCDCREQLQESLERIKEESGIVIYLQQEGRGIGAANKVAAYCLQDQGYDTVEANQRLGFEAELREYHSVPDILKDLGIESIKLMTNNPYKISMLRKLGVKITERVPIQIESNQHNERYLQVKKDRMNHFLRDDAAESAAMARPMTGGSFRMTKAVNARNAFVQEQQQQLSSVEGGYSPLSSASRSAAGAASTVDSHLAARGNIAAESTGSLGAIGMSVLEGDDSLTDNRATATSGANPSKEKAVGKDGGPGYIFGKATVEAAIDAIKRGKSVIVVDDEKRENEGDLILAAAMATPEEVGFIVRYSSGVLCVSLEAERLDNLQLPPMVVNNEDPKQTAYSISVDYKHGTSTGISAADRALTFRKLADPTVGADEFQRPGHVFPLRYKPGGVLKRAGHTEASLDLTRLAGLNVGGVLAEVVHDDGSMMRLPALEKMALEHKLVLTSVQDIIAYRIEHNC